MSKPVFISHAAANRELADALVDMLETGIGITDTDVFCSSLEGMGIPSGVNFVDFVRGQISSPRAVVLLLSQDYLASQFCLCELGASWALTHRIIPLLVPPLAYGDVKAVLTGVQLLRIDDPVGLTQMAEDLKAALEVSGKSFARWELARDKFVARLSAMDLTTVNRSSVPLEDFEKIKAQYSEAREDMSELLAQLEEQKGLIERLKVAKDADEVHEIVGESMDVIQKFNEILGAAKEAIWPLPSVVRNAIFHHFRGEHLPFPSPFDDGLKDDIRSAVEDDFLKLSDQGYEIVAGDPQVQRAIDGAGKLKRFVECCDGSSEFMAWYLREYDQRPSFTSKRFWNEHLL